MFAVRCPAHWLEGSLRCHHGGCRDRRVGGLGARLCGRQWCGPGDGRVDRLGGVRAAGPGAVLALRVAAGIDDFNSDEVPPATDTPPSPRDQDVRQTDQWKEETPRSAARPTAASCATRANPTRSPRPGTRTRVSRNG